MAQFRKKPVVIEAVKFDGVLVGMFDPTFGQVVPRTCPERFPALVEEHDTEAGARTAAMKPGRVASHNAYLFIGTLEGVMRASPGDWIIRGVSGELYPCKPDIFDATYEPA